MSYVTRHSVYSAILVTIGSDHAGEFRPKDLRPLLNCSPTAISQHLARMTFDGEVERVRMGVYRLTPLTHTVEVKVEVEKQEVQERPQIKVLLQAKRKHAEALEDLHRTYADSTLAERLRFAEEMSQLLGCLESCDD